MFEQEFETTAEVSVTVLVLEDPSIWLTPGDPGPAPWLPEGPPCACWVEDPDDCRSGAPDQVDPADAFIAALHAADDRARRDRSDRTPQTTAAGMQTGGCSPAAGSVAADRDSTVHWAIPGADRLTAGPAPLLASLTEAVTVLIDHGPLSGSRTDVTTLLTQVERLRAVALRELAEMDAVGGHQRAGVKSTTASWLRDSRHLSDGAARATVSLALALRDELPFLGQLLTTGTITVEHAAAVRDGVRGLDTDLITDAAEGLTALATCTDPVGLRKQLRDKAHAIDDRLAAAEERRARERMGLRLSDVGTHTAIDGTLPGDDGATVRLAMDLAVEADRTDGDRRSRAARQADVLIAWAHDYLHRAHGPGDSLADDPHTIRTHLHIVCRPDQLTADSAPSDGAPLTLAELIRRDLTGEPVALHHAAGIAGDRGSLSRQALRRLACDATLDLVTLPSTSTHSDPSAVGGFGPGGFGPVDLRPVTVPPDGRRRHQLGIDVGRASRTVTGRQFRALIARDQHCIVKGCRRRPAQCAAHHVRHWADGGPTDLDNLVLLCHQHHHDHHDRQQDLPHRDGRRWLTQTGWRHAPP